MQKADCFDVHWSYLVLDNMYQVILDPFNLINIKSDLIEGQLCLLHNIFHIIIGLSGSTMSSCTL